MRDKTFEIYFSDLIPAAQQEFLDLIGEKDITNTNYDVMPITSVPAPEPELQEIKLYSPLRITIDPKDKYDDGGEYDYDGKHPEISAREAVHYQHEINEFLTFELSTDENELKYGLMAYYHENDGVKDKVKSIAVSVEEMDEKLMGVATLSVYEPLDTKEMELVKDYLTGQYSDGFGEGAEQRPVRTNAGDLYVSLWQSGRDFTIRTEQEMSAKHKNRGDER